MSSSMQSLWSVEVKEKGSKLIDCTLLFIYHLVNIIDYSQSLICYENRAINHHYGAML